MDFIKNEVRRIILVFIRNGSRKKSVRGMD